MKSYKFIFTILFAFTCLFVNAQSTYKGVTIDRDSHDNTVFNAYNSNSYPVKIQIEYKIGSRDAEWRSFRNGDYVELPAHSSEKYRIGSKIYALNLTYVDILQPGVGDYIDAFVTGWEEGKKKKNSNQ
jgi:hypothetical protein